MKNKLLLIVVLVLAFLTIGARYAPTTYEYKFVYKAQEKQTNELAAQGWELVAIDAGGSDIGSVSTFVFKRAK